MKRLLLTSYLKSIGSHLSLIALAVLFLSKSPSLITPPIKEKRESILVTLSPSLPSRSLEVDSPYASDRNVRVSAPTRQRQVNSGIKSQSLKPFIPSSIKDQISLTQSSAVTNAHSPFIEDPSIPYGAENALSTREVKYFSFYKRLEDQIGPMWKYHVKRSQSLPPQGDYVNHVTIRIKENGLILQVKMNQKSITEFDQAIEKTFDEIKIVQNVPKDLLINGVAEISYRFTVQVKKSSGLGWSYERE